MINNISSLKEKQYLDYKLMEKFMSMIKYLPTGDRTFL